MTAIKTYDDLKQMRYNIANYTLGMIQLNDDIMTMPAKQKLVCLQVTPAKAIQKRNVGGYQIPYVKIGYIERCLNFISNFNRSQKILNQGYKEYTEIRRVKHKVTGEYSDKEYHILDARVAMEYTIELDGKKITHCTYGTWNMYKNPAISDYTVLEACRSQATKSFADILGIASDKISAENKKVAEAREALEVEDRSGIFEKNVKDDFGGKKDIPTPDEYTNRKNGNQDQDDVEEVEEITEEKEREVLQLN